MSSVRLNKDGFALNDLEKQVVQATENTLTPASKLLKQELANASMESVQKCKQITDMLFSNINFKSPDRKIDVTAYQSFQKTFELYLFLIENGDKLVVLNELILIKNIIQKFTKYSYIDPITKIDMGRTIQFISNKLLQMVIEQEKIEAENEPKREEKKPVLNNNPPKITKKKKKKKKKKNIEQQTKKIEKEESEEKVVEKRSNYKDYKTIVRTKSQFNSLDDIFNTFDAEDQYVGNKKNEGRRVVKPKTTQLDIVAKKSAKYKLGGAKMEETKDEENLQEKETLKDSFIIDDNDIVHSLINGSLEQVPKEEISDIDDGIESLDDEDEAKEINQKFKHEQLDMLRTEQLQKETEKKVKEITLNDDDLFHTFLASKKQNKKLTDDELYNEIDNELKTEELTKFGHGVNSPQYQQKKRQIYSNMNKQEVNKIKGKFGTLESEANKNLRIPELGQNQTIKESHNNIFKIMAAASEVPDYNFGGVNYGRTKTSTLGEEFGNFRAKKKEVINVPTKYNDFRSQKIRENNQKFQQMDQKIKEMNFNFSSFQDDNIKINKTVIDPNDL